MERDNVVGYFSAFALGSLAGAAVALLYAPRPGEETRAMMGQKIRRGADLGREKLREGAEFTRDKLEQGAEYGRQVANKVIGKGQQVADEAAAYTEALADEAQAFGERRRKPRTLPSDIPQV